jgi:hypothetical protein
MFEADSARKALGFIWKIRRNLSRRLSAMRPHYVAQQIAWWDAVANPQAMEPLDRLCREIADLTNHPPETPRAISAITLINRESLAMARISGYVWEAGAEFRESTSKYIESLSAHLEAKRIEIVNLTEQIQRVRSEQTKQ